MSFNRFRRQALGTLALALTLAGCGGGGGGGGGGNSGPINSQLAPACSGAACAAVNATTYAGQGVGIWSYANTTQSEQQIAVGLNNLGTKPVTLIYTNAGDASVAMPALALTPQAQSRALQNVSEDPASSPQVNQIPERVRRFKPSLAPQHGSTDIQPSRLAAAAPPQPLGSQRSWFIDADGPAIESRTATLRRQTSAPTPAGSRTINLWLENPEYGPGKVSDAMLDTIMQRFANGPDAVHTLVTGLAGQPWGPHNRSNLIDPDQAIDIVLVNFVPDGKPYGLLGYFWSLNDFKADPNNAQLKYSNQSLSFYIDTETLYLAVNGTTTQISTLAHEFIHMINFYQRSVLQGTQYQFDTFLEEMTALMAEDLLADRVTPGTNPMRDRRIPQWLSRPGFNCDLAAWIGSTGSTCLGYNIVGSLGAYLLRQHGIGFYQQLLRNFSATDSLQVLGNAIGQVSGISLPATLQRWGADIALLPSTAPAGYGWPARSEQGFTLPAIEGQMYANIRNLPSTVPPQLMARGHFPFMRQPDAQGRYQELLRVPAGTTLTAVVQ
ncbi:hypothetical protein GCM10010975_33870 [Comamonas phosphati]|nr:hypothetical protein GCM10010975_33870 [Comamonas phosphati]